MTGKIVSKKAISNKITTKGIIAKKLIYVAVLVSSVIYIGWRVLFTIPFGYGALSVFFGIVLLSSEIVAVVESLSHFGNMASAQSPEKPDIPAYMFPEVDVLIATHNEGVEVLRKTINGCLFLKYPDKNKVHVYICDDTDRPAMRGLAEQMGVGYFGLSGNRDAKAGNLNNALSKTYSPLVLTLDADMIPTSGLLMESVPYFFMPATIKENGVWRFRREHEIDKNEKVGFVQTPQSFYNADLFQYNLHAEKNVPNEQDFFFREINVGRNRANSAVYAGSNTLISREALQAVGGIRTKTITEDFATGLDIQAAGYTTYAIDKVLAHGLAPSDFKSLIKQRQRWARGCVQVLRSKRFLFGKLPLKTKLSYMVCFLYWWTFLRRFIYIFSPILFSVFGVVMVKCSLWELLFIWLPSYSIYTLSLKAMSGNIRSTRWSNVVDTILFPYLITPVMAETLGIMLKKFHVTPKTGGTSKNSELKYAVPHIFLAALSIIGLVFCMKGIFESYNYGWIIILFWLCLNLYMLLNAIYFCSGRIEYRNYDRFKAGVSVAMKIGSRRIRGRTSDISENGMAVLFDSPEYIPYGESVAARLAYKDYRARLDVRALHVGREGGRWKYAFEIAGCAETDRRLYTQIVFDRDHTLPNKMNSGLFREIASIVSGSFKKQVSSNRRLPRIQADALLPVESGGYVRLVDYNYEYLTLSTAAPRAATAASRLAVAASHAAAAAKSRKPGEQRLAAAAWNAAIARQRATGASYAAESSRTTNARQRAAGASYAAAAVKPRGSGAPGTTAAKPRKFTLSRLLSASIVSTISNVPISRLFSGAPTGKAGLTVPRVRLSPYDAIDIVFSERHSMRCIPVREKSARGGSILYRIDNWKELSADPQFRKKIFGFIGNDNSDGVPYIRKSAAYSNNW